MKILILFCSFCVGVLNGFCMEKPCRLCVSQKGCAFIIIQDEIGKCVERKEITKIRFSSLIRKIEMCTETSPVDQIITFSTPEIDDPSSRKLGNEDVSVINSGVSTAIILSPQKTETSPIDQIITFSTPEIDDSSLRKLGNEDVSVINSSLNTAKILSPQMTETSPIDQIITFSTPEIDDSSSRKLGNKDLSLITSDKKSNYTQSPGRIFEWSLTTQMPVVLINKTETILHTDGGGGSDGDDDGVRVHEEKMKLSLTPLSNSDQPKMTCDCEKKEKRKNWIPSLPKRLSRFDKEQLISNFSCPPHRESIQEKIERSYCRAADLELQLPTLEFGGFKNPMRNNDEYCFILQFRYRNCA